MDKTSLGDRMKFFEKRLSLTMMPMIPVICRVDGRSFHNFTKGLERPYDERFSKLMFRVTKALVEETNAKCGYTQSDEISLVWQTENPDGEIFFGGKLQKMVSIVGSLATACFNRLLPQHIPERQHEIPIFDNRVWNVPLEYEAANYFIWREMDATRNSINMAAQYLYSHSELHGKNSSEKQEMLHNLGVNWNDYPNFFKRGTYVRRRVVETQFSPEELDNLPEKHEARRNPNLVKKRTVVMAEDFPPLKMMTNREDVLLRGVEPILRTEEEDAEE